jgi:hypothetical protein
MRDLLLACALVTVVSGCGVQPDAAHTLKDIVGLPADLVAARLGTPSQTLIQDGSRIFVWEYTWPVLAIESRPLATVAGSGGQTVTLAITEVHRQIPASRCDLQLTVGQNETVVAATFAGREHVCAPALSRLRSDTFRPARPPLPASVR